MSLIADDCGKCITNTYKPSASIYYTLVPKKTVLDSVTFSYRRTKYLYSRVKNTPSGTWMYIVPGKYRENLNSSVVIISICTIHKLYGLWNTEISCCIQRGSPIIYILSRINQFVILKLIYVYIQGKL